MIYEADSLLVQVSSQYRLLRWEWQGPLVFTQFQKSLQELLVISRGHRVAQWLVDGRTMPLLGMEEQAWLSDTWLAEFGKLGVQHLALVQPTNLHNQLVIENVLSEGQRYTKINFQFFSDTPAALDWLTRSTAPLMQTLEHEWQAALLPATRAHYHTLQLQ